MSSGCGCKEVYRFPHITYPYIYTPLVSTLFCSSIPFYVPFFYVFRSCIIYSRGVYIKVHK